MVTTLFQDSGYRLEGAVFMINLSEKEIDLAVEGLLLTDEQLVKLHFNINRLIEKKMESVTLLSFCEECKEWVGEPSMVCRYEGKRGWLIRDEIAPGWVKKDSGA